MPGSGVVRCGPRGAHPLPPGAKTRIRPVPVGPWWVRNRHKRVSATLPLPDTALYYVMRDGGPHCIAAEQAVRRTPPYIRGRPGFDGDVEAGIAGRGAAGLVKSGTKSNCQQLRIRTGCLISGHAKPIDA